MSLSGLIAAIKNEHPELPEPVSHDGVVSWRLPTGWSFLARQDEASVSIAASSGERPSAWIPTSETEALATLRWFIHRKAALRRK